MTVTHDRRGLATDNQSASECAPSSPPEWLSALRQKLVDGGYDPAQVDPLLAETVERFRSGRVREFVPMFVERSVYRELRGR